MARTGTKVRPVVRAPRPAPKGGGVQRARSAVGRKRQVASPLQVTLRWLLRVETAGAAIVFVAAFALLTTVFISTRLAPLDGLVQALGLEALALLVLLGAFGTLLCQRQLGLLTSHPRLAVVLLLAAAVAAGPLGLWYPAWNLGGVRLVDASAGGDLGRVLTRDVAGIGLWLSLVAATIAIAWPRAILAALGRTPGVLATIWSWGIPIHVFHGVLAVVDFAFPTKPPPDERPSHTPPSWLPEDFYDDEDYGPTPVAVAAATPQPPAEVVVEAPMRQAALPLDVVDEEPEAEVSPVAAAAAPTWALPPMDLLVNAAPVEESARPDNALRASLIVETLASFGVDARVLQYHEGPVVTQFDVEPGWEVKTRQVAERDKDGKPAYDKEGKPKQRTEEVSRTRVRVNQITSLANDLALALAAPSLRIEAPVPGRSVVGIEVPNTSASVVTMRSVIETPAFQRLAAKSKITLPLGKSVAGEPVVADLAKMPHLLIAGATGSGKSVCINSVVASILVQSRPEDVRFVMIDPKRVELSGFAMIPHLAFSNIVVDVEKVVGTLGAVLHEMESRYKSFAALAVRNIDSYNKHPKVTQRLPYWVVIIDELADLMMAAPFEVERQICRLAQLARATGIHLIVATQRPSVDVITGLIKANFPTRIAFAMTSQVDSRTILDMAGAERLLGRGDMLYMATDASKPKRVQGVYVSDAEIDRIVAFWAQQRTTHATPVYDHMLEEAQQALDEAEDNDPLWERAKALAEEHTRMSTSMLQRRLRIGYPRAARMMDRLEEEGIVTAGGSGGSREVIETDAKDMEEDLPGFKAPY